MNTIMRRFAIVGIGLMGLSLMFTLHSEAKIDPKTAMGVWLFDEGAGNVVKDISGNKNHGEIQGAKWDKHKKVSVLSFNGTTDRVVVPDSESLYLKKAWTLTAWVLVNSAENNYGSVITKRIGNETNYAFRTGSGANGWDVYFRRDDAWQGAWNQGTIKKDTWVYMTATYDGKNTLTIYENGAKIGSADVGGPPGQNTSEVNIGARPADTTQMLHGMLYDVAIFSVELNEVDIKNLMENGAAKATGLAAVDPSAKLATVWGRVKSE